MDGASRSTHVHRFVPAPAGRLYGKVRYRNRCACGTPQHPTPRSLGGDMATWTEARAAKAERQRRERRLYTPDRRGPACRRCGFPTVAGLVDPANPLHPCCAEPQLMAFGESPRKARR